jgi:hypothetical protein
MRGGCWARRGTQRGSGVVSLVTTTSSATAVVLVNISAAGRRACVGVASSDGNCPWRVEDTSVERRTKPFGRLRFLFCSNIGHGVRVK